MSTTKPSPTPTALLPVGEILGRELDARGWTQTDFAAVLDRPTQFVSEIVTGKKEITRESAAQIAAALGHTPEYWLALQDQYLLAEQAKNDVTQHRLNDVRRRARLNTKGPVSLLQKRGILKGATLDELEAEVLELFEIRTFDDEPSFVAAAKRSNENEPIAPLQMAWVACVRRKAREEQPPQKFSPEPLKSLGAALPRILTSPEAFADLPQRLAEVGVHLVYVEALPGAKIDGCAMFVDGFPVIGLSGRGKRLDKVLFTLLHEIAHIALGHVDANTLIVESLDDGAQNDPADQHEEENDLERAANTQASSWVFPNGLTTVPHRIGAPWIANTAAREGIAPIVLVGHLQHLKRLDWRTTLARKAPTVTHILEAW
ncbi:helix-turn-helix transcriptional regulator [Rhodococcus pyridinivorans]|uniref:helix-turn-helix transcriptional regulator n=1 Tax=Rhodococcus TaxID=1827 RepID=UPI001C7E09B2|nr:helix-turn-helix domain-containing protein [Rhodococcus sp. DMU2021]MBX4171805.1 helix-turn-helix domain-containing protein [Rhodococcus sp. DMU2021]